MKHRKVSLHPVVREMITRKGIPFQYEYIKPYVNALNNRLFFRTYATGVTSVMKMGVAASEILEKIRIEFVIFNYIRELESGKIVQQ